MMILRLLLVLVAVASHANSASVGERDALLAFKSGFAIHRNISAFIMETGCPDGSAYAKTETWVKNGSCCEWDGVTCDSLTGHVVGLNLSCSLLTGSFPSNTTLFLLNLPRLRYLDLSYNTLSGQVPPEIGWLSQLTTLDLSGNDHLTMPNFQTIIANMTHLRNLHLSRVSIPSNLPPIIFNLSKLAYLDLHECGLRGEFPAANVNTSMLARVTDIDLSFNMLTGIIPTWIYTRPSLNALSLSDNFFTGISEFEIGNGSSMTSFDASNNHLQGKIPDGIFELHNLVGAVPTGKQFNTFLDSSYLGNPGLCGP